jgi:hypothetical protein
MPVPAGASYAGHGDGIMAVTVTPSISKVGPSISVYYDIKDATFDIEDRKMTFDIGYDMTTRYRRF